MLDADTIIHEALKRRLGESSLHITMAGGEISVKPFRKMEALDLRRKAKEHGWPLHHGEGYVAVSQWNIETDEASYYVVRE